MRTTPSFLSQLGTCTQTIYHLSTQQAASCWSPRGLLDEQHSTAAPSTLSDSPTLPARPITRRAA